MPNLGLTDKKYISVLDPLLDTRDIDQRIAAVQRDESFMSFLHNAQMKAAFDVTSDEAKNAVYHSWVEDPLTELIDTTGATVTGSGTPTVTVTVLPSASQNKLVVGTLLYMPNGVSARVQTTPTAASFTATSVDGGNITLTAGMILSAYSSAEEEGSDAPAAMRWGVTRISNNLQIIRTTISMTDVQQQSGVEFKVNGEASVVPYEAIRGFNLQKQKISAAFLLGTRSGTLFSDASPSLTGGNGRGVQTTRGMYDYIKTYGANASLTTAGTMTIADLTSFEQLLVGKRSAMRFIVGGSHSVIATFSNFVKGLPSSGAIASTRIIVNGKEVDLQVDKFEHAGFEFNLNSMGLFNNQQVVDYAASGSTKTDIAKSALFMPIGQVNSVGNSAKPYFRYRYAPMVGGVSANRKIKGEHEEIITGGLAPVPTDGKRLANVTWTATVGLEVAAPQHFGALKVL